MLSKFAQKLNKSLTSNKSNSPEKTIPVEPCKLCHGVGCCYLCEKNDDWDKMVCCSNKKENHFIHQTCDNLTDELVKCICHYYCPKCRQDGNFKVTFYKRVGENKRNEIRDLLKIIPKPVILPKNILSKPKFSLGTVNQTLESTKIPKKPEDDKFIETPLVNLEPEDVSQIITEVMESLLQEVSSDLSVIPTDSEGDTSLEELSEEDSFREIFPGQHSNHNLTNDDSIDQSNKSISPKRSSEDDSFGMLFPEQTSNKDNHTPSDEELLTVSLPNDKSINFSKKVNSSDSSNTSSQTSESYIHDRNQEKANLINLVNVLTEKLKSQHEENLSLKSIIQGQEHEISALQNKSLKYELELEEAEAVIRETSLELEDMKEEFDSLDKTYKELKFLTINPNEAYEHPPMEVFEFYKKESLLSKKKSVQIKCLLNENKSYKNNLMELKNENEDLRGKVRNLIEEDIDKKILNFCIEENRRLELKIKIQRKRNIKMGREFKEQMNKTYDLEEKNEEYKEKIANLEKITKDNSQIMATNEWETISLNSEPEVDIALSSQKSSSPKPKQSIEFLVKKALKQILIEEKIPPKGDAPNSNSNTKPDKTTSNNNSLNTQSSGVKTGEKIIQNRSICKFFLQNRCIFGYKCRNIHSKGPQQAYIPPWNPTIFPNGVFESANHPSFNSRPNKQPNQIYSITGFGDHSKGKSVGYWSAPPIPIEQTRFSHLSEFNLDGNNFPVLN